MKHLDCKHVVGLGAALETGDAIIYQFCLGVDIVGKFGLLASDGKSLQEVCGALLMEYGKAGKGLVKIVFINVGGFGALGFDQLKSSITKSFVAVDKRMEVYIHLGRYYEK